jgi:hypothetical protein
LPGVLEQENPRCSLTISPTGLRSRIRPSSTPSFVAHGASTNGHLTESEIEILDEAARGAEGGATRGPDPTERGSKESAVKEGDCSTSSQPVERTGPHPACT